MDPKDRDLSRLIIEERRLEDVAKSEPNGFAHLSFPNECAQSASLSFLHSCSCHLCINSVSHSSSSGEVEGAGQEARTVNSCYVPLRENKAKGKRSLTKHDFVKDKSSHVQKVSANDHV